MEDEPSPQSEIQSAVDLVIINDVSVHCYIHFPSSLTSLPLSHTSQIGGVLRKWFF